MLIRMQQLQLDRDVDPDGGDVLRRCVANIPQPWTGQPMGLSRPFVAPNHSRFMSLV